MKASMFVSRDSTSPVNGWKRSYRVQRLNVALARFRGLAFQGHAVWIGMFASCLPFFAKSSLSPALFVHLRTNCWNALFIFNEISQLFAVSLLFHDKFADLRVSENQSPQKLHSSAVLDGQSDYRLWVLYSPGTTRFWPLWRSLVPAGLIAPKSFGLYA